ncbi:MAG: peptide ABC transporter substrate-binding protein [Chloroflexi bacterium]|nr:peptide ABC transporter substrate-binding protein [Chloroflexota bacterium]
MTPFRDPEESVGTIRIDGDERRRALAMSRRAFVRYSAFVGGGIALLAACAPSAPPAPTAAPTKPAAAPPTAAPAAPTAAPAAATAAPAVVPTRPAAAAPTAAPAAAATVVPTPAPAKEQPKKGGQVIIHFSQEPQQFNPLLSAYESERGVQYAIFNSLWRMTDEGKYVPDLATEVPSVQNGGISADGTTYTFKLRKDVKWHDGQPFTAKDVKFTHDAVMDKNVNAASRVGHDLVTSIEVVDNATLKLKLKEPFAPFLAVWMDRYIVPEHILSKVPDINKADFNFRSPVGTGPFIWQERVAGDHITVKANPNYHGPGPYLDRAIYTYIPDLEVAYAQFKAAAYDFTGFIPLDKLEDRKNLKGRSIESYATAFVEYIYMDNQKPQFKEKAVRQALMYGMDKNAIIKGVYYGAHQPTSSYMPPTHWAYNKDLKPYEYSPDRAKKLLDDAGWKPGADGIRAKDGVKLSFSNSTTAGNKLREQAQQILQQQWKQIGVDMQIKNMPAAVVWGEYLTKTQFDSLMVGWHMGLGADPDTLVKLHSNSIPAETGSGANYVRYKNPAMDKLLEQGTREMETEKRKSTYAKVQEILHDELPWLPIFNYIFVFGRSDTLRGQRANLYVVWDTWNLNEWWQAK